MKSVVILGTGAAGYSVARELRKTGVAMSLGIVTRDGGEFYPKPRLSNSLTSATEPSMLVMSTAEKMSEQLDAKLYLHTQCETIDLASGKLITNKGDIPFDELVLATGAAPLRLSIAGDAAGDILSVNSLDDYRVFRQQLKDKRHVLLIGGGLIGSEFANDLVGSGYSVDVVEPMTTPLASLIPAQAGQALAAKLTEHGVRWHFGNTVTEVNRLGSAYHVKLSGGDELKVDLVLSAVGLRPDITLAKAAGIVVDRGIVVDTNGRSSAANVFAIGDCAQYPGKGVMLYIAPIQHAAQVIASNIAGTASELAFSPMPVAIKTSLWPLTILPADPGTKGEWRVLGDGEGGLAMAFVDEGGILRGFMLNGSHGAKRMQMAKRIGTAEITL